MRPPETAQYRTVTTPDLIRRHAQDSPQAGLAQAYRRALEIASEFSRDGFPDHALGAAHVADAIQRELQETPR